ncbi:hypothetical protein [Mycobacterium sp. 050134]|uniref:hypothetical protein n=1 Tax=Mycobacterium sp. 050134 TaxID=3096111 RepID=UPI002ED7F250
MHPFRALREKGDNTPEQVAYLLAEDVEFRTPVLIAPVMGRSVVSRILATSSRVRSGKYIREEKLDERTTFLHWIGVVGGHELEALELLEDDENGLIAARTVAYRPFPALAVFRSAMYASLKDLVAPHYWSYTPDDPMSMPS